VTSGRLTPPRAPARAGRVVVRAATARWRLAVFAGILALGALGAWRLGFFDLRDMAQLNAAVVRAREQPAVEALFVLGYVVVVALGLPASPLTLAAGALFGPVLGTTLVIVASTTGAVIAYWLARHLASDMVRGWLERAPGGLGTRLTERLDGVHGWSGFLVVLRLRLLPIFPFAALSFAMGLARVPVASYVVGTVLGALPWTAAYVVVADALLAGVTGASRAALGRAGAIAGAVLLVTFAPAIVRLVRRVRSSSATGGPTSTGRGTG
jgi:uncharacterized membrane protein YdjX (TVP38/TMEM64 family)